MCEGMFVYVLEGWGKYMCEGMFVYVLEGGGEVYV